jgi:hypothetical protein
MTLTDNYHERGIASTASFNDTISQHLLNFLLNPPYHMYRHFMWFKANVFCALKHNLLLDCGWVSTSEKYPDNLSAIFATGSFHFHLNQDSS